MKKLIYITLLGLSFMSCEKQETVEPKTEQNQESTEVTLYTRDGVMVPFEEPIYEIIEEWWKKSGTELRYIWENALISTSSVQREYPEYGYFFTVIDDETEEYWNYYYIIEDDYTISTYGQFDDILFEQYEIMENNDSTISLKLSTEVIEEFEIFHF